MFFVVDFDFFCFLIVMEEDLTMYMMINFKDVILFFKIVLISKKIDMNIEIISYLFYKTINGNIKFEIIWVE